MLSPNLQNSPLEIRRPPESFLWQEAPDFTVWKIFGSCHLSGTPFLQRCRSEIRVMFVIVSFCSRPLFRFDALDADGVEVGQFTDVVAHLPWLDIVCPGFV
jgi:hypothetical protein